VIAAAAGIRDATRKKFWFHAGRKCLLWWPMSMTACISARRVLVARSEAHRPLALFERSQIDAALED